MIKAILGFNDEKCKQYKSINHPVRLELQHERSFND